MVWTLAIPYIILVDDLCAVGMNIILLNQIDVQVIVWGLALITFITSRTFLTL